MNVQRQHAACGAGRQHTSMMMETRHVRRVAPFALALIGMFATTQASAGLPVIDPVAIAQDFDKMLEDRLQFIEQGKRWIETKNHIQRQMIKLQQLQFGRSIMADDFPDRPVDYGMEDRCPGPSGGLQALKGRFIPQMDGNIVDQQTNLCQRAVLAENAKYNDSVKMLRTLIKRNEEFAKIDEQRKYDVGENPGALEANSNEAQRFVIRTKMDLDYWQARMRAYDDYILALQNDQSRLARRALEGKKTGSGIGRVIGTDSIKSAFSF